ncbi:MAG: choice-of-anchor D domain-containing protein [Terriglobales bacterium]|jgi:hypothetical protein
MRGMRFSRWILLALAAAPAHAQTLSHPAPLAALKSADSLALPMAFEVNRGQAQTGIDFVARAKGYSVYLRPGRVTLHRSDSGHDGVARTKATNDVEVGICLLGTSGRIQLLADDKLPGYSNYLFGSDPDKWLTNVSHYAKVRYANVYSGIDVVYHGNQDRLEDDFVVRPGADPRQISLGFSGVDETKVSAEGELVLRAGGSEFRMQKPRAYQLIAGRELEVEAAYVLQKGHALFHLGHYDRSRTVIVDPVLVYATFFGGSEFGPSGGGSSASAVAVDGSGNLYVAGNASSTNFPITPGVVGPTQPPDGAFVSKINPDGTSLIYSTYIAGMNFNSPGLVVDASGNVYLAAQASPGLPIPPGSKPFESQVKTLALLKLNSTATSVLSATYFGGSGSDYLFGLAVDGLGSAYLTGSTNSNDFPTQSPMQGSLGTSQANGFVSKFNPTMSGLIYSTYLGQDSTASAKGIGLDASGDAYVVGTASPGFPTTTGAFQTTATATSAFFAKLDPTGSSILYATYDSGSSGSSGNAVVLDGSGNVYLAGRSTSLDFPVVNPIQPCTGNGLYINAAFLSEFNAAGALVFATCLGNTGTANATMLGALGNIYVSGISDASLLLKNAIDANVPPLGPPPETRSFISEIAPDTQQLVFSSFVGGPPQSNQFAQPFFSIDAITVDLSGNIYAVGEADAGLIYGGSPTPPLFPIFNALQPLFGNTNGCFVRGQGCVYGDATIIKISPNAGAAAAIAPTQVQFSPTQVGSTSAPFTVTIYDLGTDPLMVSNVAINGDFAQTNNCGAVPPSGGSCAIQVTFTPTIVGTLTGTVTITDSSPGSPHTVQLTGIGAQATATPSPSSLSFAGQLVGIPSASQTITITNDGAVNLQVSRVQTTGPFGENNSCSAPVQPQQRCTINVTFTPTATGAATGAVSITDNAANSPQTIPLKGTGTTGFEITATTPTASVTAGGTATFSLAATGSTGFSGSVQFTCSGLPPASTCTASPNPLNLTGGSPSTVSVAVATTAQTTAQYRAKQGVLARLPYKRMLGTIASAFMLGTVLMPVGLLGKRGENKKRSLVFIGFVLLSIGFGCGGGGGSNVTGTPSGTYPITVTASSGSISQPTTLTLKVQ